MILYLVSNLLCKAYKEQEAKLDVAKVKKTANTKTIAVNNKSNSVSIETIIS